MAEGTLAERPATELLAMFARGETTPVALLDACLARIGLLNPAINALTAFAADRAYAEAEAATRRWQRGTPLGALDGLPIGVKDLQETEGLLTTYGSPVFRGHVPERDMALVARLRRAGAIVLAKTNVPEMGAGGNTVNPVWGATGNPFDPRLVAGGSSGGSAAALAADLVPLCTGSDTGGSLRLPAAVCGVVGYRPSPSVVAHPSRPVGWSAISVLGPMARNMADLLLMLGACLGFDPGDPLSGRRMAEEFGQMPEARLDRLRIGFSEDFGGAPVDPAIRKTFRARVAAIWPHVAECRPVDLNLGEMDRVFDILRAESFLAAFDQTFREAPATLGPHVRDNVALGQDMTLGDRAWAHAEQTRILRAYNARIAGLDLILTPTVPVSPYLWTVPYPQEIDGRRMDTYYRWLALTYRSSVFGAPALTLPAGRDRQGMPFGLQLLGHAHGDAALLAAALTLEGLLEASPETARPRPDPARLVPPPADLKAAVTHPPARGGAAPAAAAATAV